MDIFVTRSIPKIGLEALKEEGFNVDVFESTNLPKKEDIISALKKKEYVGILSVLTEDIDEDVMNACPQLKIISNFAVGYDNIDIEKAKEKNITVTNTPGVLTNSVSEYTASLILSLARRVVEADKFVRDGLYEAWGPELMLGVELKGKELGIIGAGRIGTKVAEIMNKGFGMNISYFNSSDNEYLDKELNASKKSLEEILTSSDVISIHLPLNKDTKGFISKKELDKMKNTALLINTSRGPIISEKDLLSSLKEKKILGAALDVFENEPVIEEGLKSLDNVILTPHIASGTVETRNEMALLAARNLINFLKNKGEVKVVA